jgi:hypothetical protein
MPNRSIFQVPSHKRQATSDKAEGKDILVFRPSSLGGQVEGIHDLAGFASEKDFLRFGNTQQEFGIHQTVISFRPFGFLLVA